MPTFSGVVDDPEVLATVYGFRQTIYSGLLETTIRNGQVRPGWGDLSHGLYCLLGVNRTVRQYIPMLAGPVLLRHANGRALHGWTNETLPNFSCLVFGRRYGYLDSADASRLGT